MGGDGRTALVTGGAGFIGGHIVEELLRSGWNVRVIDRDVEAVDRLSGIAPEAGYRVADITVVDAGDTIFRQVDAILHEAALVSVPASFERVRECVEDNVWGTMNLLEAARLNRIPKFAFASSCAVYGNRIALPIREINERAPLSPYAWSKASGEDALAYAARLHGLDATAFRYFNVYGPRQAADSPYSGVIAQFARRALAKAPAVIYGDGEQSRDFVYVQDVARFNRLAVEGPVRTGSYRCLNACTGASVTIIDLWRSVCRAAEVEAEQTFEPERSGDIRKSEGDPRRLAETFGAVAEWSLQNGLAETVKWYREAGVANLS